MSSRSFTYVFVQLPGSEDVVVAGRYEFDPPGIGSFVYGASYLSRPDAFPLDPRNLPLGDSVSRTTLNNGLFGALRDAAPDAWGRLVMTRSGSPETELDFLLGTSDTRVGALSFGQTTDPPNVDWSSALPLEDIAPAVEAAANLQAEVAGEAEVPAIDPNLLNPGSSLGGARPKTTVIDSDGQLWVAKFPGREDLWENAVVERGLLMLAGECRIQVPDTELIEVDGRRVLLVKRFDCWPGPVRRAFLSAHSLLGLDAGTSLDARDGWSYNDFAHVVRAESIVPKRDTEELFRRVVFNALTSNEDDHPRNHAMVRTEKGWQLSPAYDLTPSRTKSVETRKHAMRVGRLGDLDPRLMRRRNLLSAADDFLLTESTAGEIVDEVRETITRRWRDVLSAAGATDRTLELVEHAFPDSYPGFEY